MKKIISIMLGLMLLTTAFAGLAKSASGEYYATSKSTIELNPDQTRVSFGNYEVELVSVSDNGALLQLYEGGSEEKIIEVGEETNYEDNNDFNLIYDGSISDRKTLYLTLEVPLERNPNGDYGDLEEGDTSGVINNFEFEIVNFEHNDNANDKDPYSNKDDEVEVRVNYLGKKIGTEWIEEGESDTFENEDFNSIVRIELDDDDTISDKDDDIEEDTPYVKDGKIDVYFPGSIISSYEIIAEDSDSGSDSGSDGGDQTSLLEDYLMFSGESIELSNGDSYTISTTSSGLVSDQVYLQVEENGEVIEDSIGLSEYTSSRESVGSLELAIGAIDTQRESYYLNVWAPSDYSISQEPDREAGVSMNPTLGNNEAIVGQQVEVQIQGIESIGSADAYGLKVVGPVPDGFDLSGNNVMGPVDLASGDVLSDHTYFLEPNSAGEYELGDVEATYSDDEGERSNTFAFDNSTLTVYGEPDVSAGVQVLKNGTSSDEVEVLPNENVTVNFDLENNGDGPAKNVQVILDGVSKSVDEIGAGESVEVSFSYITGEAGAKTVDSQISFDNALEEDSETFDKPIPMVIAEPPKPSLSVESMVVSDSDSDNPMDTIDANEPVVYRVKISNDGEAVAQDVRVDFRNISRTVGDIDVNETKNADIQYVFEEQGETELFSNVTYTYENAVDNSRDNVTVSKQMNVQNTLLDFNPQTMIIMLIIALAIIAAAYYYNKSNKLEEEKGRRKDLTKEGGLPDHEK